MPKVTLLGKEKAASDQALTPNPSSVTLGPPHPRHHFLALVTTLRVLQPSVSPGSRGTGPGAFHRPRQRGRARTTSPQAWSPKMSPFCSRGIGLFIGVDLIKDEATRKPATEEANYMVSRYFFLETSCLCSVQGPDWEGAPPHPGVCCCHHAPGHLGPTEGCLKELAAGPEQGRGHRSVCPSAWWPAPCSHGFTWVRAVHSQGRQGHRGSQTQKLRFTSPGGPGGSCFSAATPGTVAEPDLGLPVPTAVGFGDGQASCSLPGWKASG